MPFPIPQIRIVRVRSIRWLFILISSATADSRDSGLVELERFRAELAVDFGQVVKGVNGVSEEFEYQPINRNTVVLEQDARIGEDWRLKAAFMGLIWWPFNTNPTEPIHRTMRAETRIREASAARMLGSSEVPTRLKIGFFPYKYNRDAHNLGEYLYRSGTYPGVVYTTDGFNLMGRSDFDAYGASLRVSHLGGRLTHGFNLFLETNFSPIGDLTPAYEFSFRGGIFDLGFGFAYNRGISFRPSQLNPRTAENAHATLVDARTDSLGNPDTVAVSGRLSQLVAFSPIDTVIHGYWTKRGLKVMARASLDFGFLLPEEFRGPEDLRLFFEAAVLGWENQGYFYENRTHRMPVMAGINLPAFKALDLLSLQVEYYAARFSNTQSYTSVSLPVWDVESFSEYDPSEFRRDDWKWSVSARKRIGSMARLHAQVANDHLRLREFLLQQSDQALTRNPSNWYYLLRLECGI